MSIQIGLAASPYVKSSLGFLGNFGISMGFTITAMICTVFLRDSRTMRPSESNHEVTETKDVTVPEDKGCCKVITSIFDARNIKRALNVTFKKRAYNTRPVLLILVSNFILYFFIIIGRDSTIYLYTREVKNRGEVFCIQVTGFCSLRVISHMQIPVS